MHIATTGHLHGAINGLQSATQLTDTGEDVWRVEAAIYYGNAHYKVWRRDGDGFVLIDDTMSVYGPTHQVSDRAEQLPPGLRMDDGFVCTVMLLRRL